MKPAADSVVAEEKTEFEVVLKDTGASKINVIKEVCGVAGLDVKVADDIEGKLETTGAAIELAKPTSAGDFTRALIGGLICDCHQCSVKLIKVKALVAV